MRNNCGLISTNTSIELIGVFNNFIKNAFTGQDSTIEYSKLEDLIAEYVYKNHKRDNKENALTQEEANFIDMQFAIMALSIKPILFKSDVDKKFSEKIWKNNKSRDIKLFLIKAQEILIDSVNTTLPAKVKALYDTDVIEQKEVIEPLEDNTLPISAIAPKLIGDIKGVSNKVELKTMFANANTAYLMLTRRVSNHIVRNYLINPEGGIYNTNSVQVDKSIKNNKIRIYEDLIRNFESKNIKFSDSEKLYYKDGKLNSETEVVLNRIGQYYNSKNITNVDLEHWTQTNGSEISDYINYIILSNFDNLLLSYGKGVFKISESYLNSMDEKLDKPKYILDIQSNIGSSIFETGEYNITDEQSSLFKMFISSMPSISLDGTVNLDKEVNINTVNNVMSKLLHSREFVGAPKYDPTNSLESIKALVEFAINNFTRDSYVDVPKIQDFKKVEKDVLFSIYMYFFRDPNELITSKSNVIMKETLRSKLRESYGSRGTTGEISYVPSFYQLASKSGIITGIDYYSLMISNFDKTYQNDYTEYAYDKDKKVVTVNNPKEKMINSSEIQFTNNLNNFINQDFSSNKDIILDKFKNVELVGDDFTTVVFNLGNKKNITIDLINSEVTYFNGKKLSKLEEIDNFSYMEERPLLMILNKILPSLQLTDDNGNDFYYTTYKDIFSEVDKNVTVLAELSRVAAYAAFISKRINEVGKDELLKNRWIKSLTSNYYNLEDEEFSMAGLFNRYSDISNKIGEGLGIINNEAHKAVIAVGNVTVPTVGEVRHLYTLPKWRTWLMNQNEGTLRGMPIQNNLFMENPDFLEGFVIRSFVKIGDTPKHSSKMSPQEVMHTLILHDYISAATKYDKVFIQPTVFADKNSHNSVVVNLKAKVKIPGIARKVTLNTVTSNDLKEAIYLNNHTYYKAIEKRITSTYIPVLEQLLGRTVENNARAVSEAMSSIKEDKINGKSGARIFRDAFYKFYNGKEYLIEDLGIKTRGGIASISPLLLHYIDMYNTPGLTTIYKNYIDKNEKSFADNLSQFNNKIEFKDSKGKLNPLFSVSSSQGANKTIFDKINTGITIENFEKTWVDPNTKYLIIHNGTELNPLLKHFFYMDNYISENLMQASMGTLHNHPFKGDPTTSSMEQMESSQQTAEYKRQLQGTPMKPLNLGLINGVGETMKIVFMTDINNPTFTSFGIEDVMTTSDGSAQIVPLQFILQNNSLLENSVGANAKLFSLFMDPKYNSYGLTKYAEFGITNEMIKYSKGATYDLSKLIEKSYSYGNFTRTLVRENEVIQIPFNILKDFKGKDINIDTVAPGGLFFEKNGDIYQILSLSNDITIENEDGSISITKGKPNQFSRKIINLTTKIPTTELPVDVNNLYDLWKLLGAENSVSIDSEGKFKGKFNYQDTNFTESDSSHQALAEFVNRVGYKKNNAQKNNLKSKYDLTEEEFIKVFPEFKVTKSSFLIDNQNNTWQPLKDMFIGKFVHASAQKSGAINIQHIDDVYGTGAIYPVDVPAISTGLLMDTDHEVEGSEITRMGQIISAIEFMGESHNVSRGVYNAIADVLNIKLKNLLDTVVTGKVNKAALYKEVTDNLIKTFNSKDQQSIGKFIGDMVSRENDTMRQALQNAKAQEQEDKKNSQEMSEEVEEASSLPVSLLINGKKMPFSTYMYGSFVSLMSNFLNKTAIRDKQSGIASPIKPSGGMIQVYDNYHETNGLSTVLGKINAKLNPDEHIESELINTSEISLYDWIRLSTGEEICIDTPRKLIKYKSIEEKVDKLFGKPRDLRPPHITFNVEGIKNAPMSIYELSDFMMVFDFKDIVEGKRSLKDSPELINFLKKKNPGIAITNGFLVNNTRAINNLLRLNIQGILDRLDTQKTILIDGTEHLITNLSRKSGEGIGPDIYRLMFGLPKGVSVSEITEEYLYDKIIEKAKPYELNDSLCQYYFQNPEGNHVYVYDDKPLNFIEYKKGEQIRDIDGQSWVVDEFGDRKYLSGNFIIGYTTVNGKKIEVIIAENDTRKEQLISLMKDTRKVDPDLYIGNMYNTNVDNNAILEKQSRYLAKKRYSSFRTTLSFIAARIPGQGYQSFTDIDIVDFIHTEGNTVMTNHFTSWLKGEDYDIDKGFWLGLALNNGSIVGWAKEFDYSTEDTLRNSMSLPYPDKITRTYSDTPEVTLSSDEVKSLFDENMTKLRSETLLKLGSVDTFNYVNTINDPPTLQEKLLNLVNDYFMQNIPSGKLENALKNKIVWGIRDAVTKPSNLVNTESPISMDDPRDAAKGASTSYTSAKDPTSKAKFQHANMVGKDVIGIAAIALKIWSAVSYYGNDVVKGGNINSILIGKNVKINGKNHYIAAQANLNFKTKAATIINDEFIRNQIEKNNIKEKCNEL